MHHDVLKPRVFPNRCRLFTSQQHADVTGSTCGQLPHISHKTLQLCIIPVAGRLKLLLVIHNAMYNSATACRDGFTFMHCFTSGLLQQCCSCKLTSAGQPCCCATAASRHEERQAQTW